MKQRLEEMVTNVYISVGAGEVLRSQEMFFIKAVLLSEDFMIF